MPSYCQACDKEMKLTASQVLIEGYITCGAPQCAEKARKWSKEFTADVVREEAQREISAVVLRSKTPDDVDSFRPVPTDELPAFLQNRDIFLQMLEERQDAHDSATVDGYWYRVVSTSEVLRTLQRENDKRILDAAGKTVH